MRRAFATLMLLGTAACAPDLGTPPSVVDDLRILAVSADAPDLPLNASTTYHVLVAGRHGNAKTADAHWAFCNAPKPLAENDVVPEACVGDAVVSAGRGSTVSAIVPADACELFGSDLPPGQSGLRPRDPDATGGYYQPMRVEVDGLMAFGLERIVCNLANAPENLAIDWLHHYKLNQNPVIRDLRAEQGGAALDLAHVLRGAAVTFRLSWPASSKESYVWFDSEHQRVVTRQESLDAAWFATRGTFADDRTGRSEDETETDTSNDWTAPSAGGDVHLWVVLRDSRGGVAWTEREIHIE